MSESPNQTEILSAMRMGVDYRLEISLRAFKILVRPLSNAENLEVAQEVIDRLMRLKPEHRTPQIESTLRAQITLMKASTSEPGSKDPRLTEYEMERMTPDEIAFLFKQYASACDKVNPGLESLPAEQIALMAEELKKNPSEAIELSFLDLVNIVRFLLTTDG